APATVGACGAAADVQVDFPREPVRIRVYPAHTAPVQLGIVNTSSTPTTPPLPSACLAAHPTTTTTFQFPLAERNAHVEVTCTHALAHTHIHHHTYTLIHTPSPSISLQASAI